MLERSEAMPLQITSETKTRILFAMELYPYTEFIVYSPYNPNRIYTSGAIIAILSFKSSQKQE